MEQGCMTTSNKIHTLEINSMFKRHRDMNLVSHMIKSCEALRASQRFDYWTYQPSSFTIEFSTLMFVSFYVLLQQFNHQTISVCRNHYVPGVIKKFTKDWTFLLFKMFVCKFKYFKLKTWCLSNGINIYELYTYCHLQ